MGGDGLLRGYWDPGLSLPDLSPQSQSWREKEGAPPFCWCHFYGPGWAPAGLVPSSHTPVIGLEERSRVRKRLTHPSSEGPIQPLRGGRGESGRGASWAGNMQMSQGMEPSIKCQEEPRATLACAKFALGRVVPPDRPLAWLGVQGWAWNGMGVKSGVGRGSQTSFEP